MPCFCIIAFGIGLFLGKWIDSWFWCGGGSVLLIGIGISVLRRR